MNEPKKKLNCWEFKNCGREPGGSKVDDYGVCPATIEMKGDGINSGTCGGRICWAVSGTYCRGEIQGIFATKITSCSRCDFFHLVDQEEKNSLKEAEKYLHHLYDKSKPLKS